jgi:hypothetical protein
MNEGIRIIDPVAHAQQQAQDLRHSLDGLAGKVVGFIDNAKPNFNHLVDDLEELLTRKYGVAGVIKHRKRGSVPAGDEVMKRLAQECDAVITGSGD